MLKWFKRVFYDPTEGLSGPIEDNKVAPAPKYDPLNDPDYSLQILVNSDGKPRYNSRGEVVLSTVRKSVPLEHFDYERAQKVLIWKFMQNRQKRVYTQDAPEEEFDFGAPSDYWNDVELPGQLNETKDLEPYFEDQRFKDYHLSSQQPSDDSQDE